MRGKLPKQRSGILAAGNWIIDHVKVVDRWPPQDSIACILRRSCSNGGSPYNILKDLRHLGAPFPLAAAGLVGRDDDGRTILDDCARHGIDTTLLEQTDAAPTSFTDVMTVHGTGRRTFFHSRGANALFNASHLVLDRTRARIFHLGYLLLLDQLDTLDARRLPRSYAALAAARAAGMSTSIDLVSEDSDRYASVVRPVLPQVDFLFVNDFEMQRLTSTALRHDETLSKAAVERAADHLLVAGVRSWVVVHFPEGVFACSHSGDSVWQPSVVVPPDSIKGTAGAGDAIAAGVLLGLHEGWSMTKCLRLGVCAAAACLFHPTCSEGVADVSACLALGEQHGFRKMPAE